MDTNDGVSYVFVIGAHGSVPAKGAAGQVSDIMGDDQVGSGMDLKSGNSPGEWVRQAMLSLADLEPKRVAFAEGPAWSARPLRAGQSPTERRVGTRHSHSYSEICLPLESPLVMEIAPRRCKLQPPALAVVDPDVTHAEALVGRHARYTMLWVNAVGASGFIHLAQYDAQINRQFMHVFQVRSRLVARLSACLQESPQTRADMRWFELLRACLMGIFADVCAEETQGPPQAYTRSRVHRYEQSLTHLRAHLDEHLNQRHAVAQLGQLMRLSPNYLNHLFKQWSGESVHRYLVRRRMETAMELCQRGDLLMKEVARKVGFRDPLYFSRAFHRYHGVWPTEISGK